MAARVSGLDVSPNAGGDARAPNLLRAAALRPYPSTASMQ